GAHDRAAPAGRKAGVRQCVERMGGSSASGAGPPLRAPVPRGDATGSHPESCRRWCLYALHRARHRSRLMISVIVCSIDPAKFAAVSESYAHAFEGEAYEIVAIHDARSLCEGYNRALRLAKGDFCVFSHDDIDILATDLGARLRRHLANY